MNENQNIMNVPTTELGRSQLLPPINELSINHEDFLKMAEKRFDAINEIKKMTLSCTTIHDWVDFSGKAYLTIGGCQKIARLFGLSWKIIKNEKNVDSETGHYFYKITGEFWISKSEKERIVEIGTRGSNDKFFGTKNKEQRPLSEIDETNIQKSAITNCISRGVKAILGLGNITWDEINKYKSSEKQIKKDKVASVTYATGSQGGSRSGKKITVPQSGRLYGIYKNNNITNDQMKDYLLTNYDIVFDPSDKNSFLQIDQGKMYDEICAWANAQ